MLSRRSWPVLLIGFGLLIGLIALSGLGALRRAKQTYKAVLELDNRYRRTEQLLSEVGSNIAVVGLLARDYLLDPSLKSAEGYRSDLMAVRSKMEDQLDELTQFVRPEDAPKLSKVRQEVEAYWDALDPLFEWTPEERARRSWAFLRHEVLTKRGASFAIAKEIRDLTQANLDREREEVDREQASVPSFIIRMMIITTLLGAAIAGITMFRMTHLEQRSDEQRERTEAAEKELRLLSRQLVRAQEQERKSISRELHDEIGQKLTALRMELGSLQKLRAEGLFDEHLEDAKKLTEQSLRSVRDIAMGLRPSMLDDLGLGPAVQWQARQFSKHTGVPVNVQITGQLSTLPERHRTCVYRVVQEALTNCARHAAAKTIRVAIDGRGDQLSLLIQDDGAGFDSSGFRGRGLGLIGIEERVKELGGEIRLTSKPKMGTVLSAVIPVPEEAAAAQS